MIIDTDYVTENGKPVIRIFKIENGKFKIEYDRDFQPYIYALLKDDSAIEEVKKITGERHGKVVKVVKAEKVQKKFLGKPIEVWKLIFQHPQDVPAIRNKIREHPAVIDIFEYDIPFAKRYLIDKNLVPMEGDEKLKLMAFDIETFYTEGQEFGEGQIIMISYADEEEAKVITWKKIDLPYVEVVSSEREMIKRFVQIVREKDPDVLITYNGDNFDVPYLVKRARKLGVKLMLGRDKENSEPKIERMGNRFAVEIKGRIHFDLFPVVRRTVNLPHYTLEAVYEAVLGKKKTKLQAEEISMIWESREGMKALAQYSMEDAKATYELGKEFFPMEAELSKLIAQSVWDVSRSSTGNLVEWFLLRIAYQKNELAPNKPSNEEYQRRLRTTYIGGYVKEPERGLWGNIVYLDFRALYPSIIVEHNISPDTLEREGCKNYDKAPIVGYRFCKDFPGFIPSILGNLIKERQAVKKKMKETSGVEQKMLDYRQRALKILANSFYGYMGYPKARWYSKESAESVTAWGRYYIENTIKEIEKWGFKVLYADSVSGDTEVIVREKGKVKFVKIKDLFKNVEYKLGEKEYCTLQDVEALTLNDNGKLVWKKVPYVMRHLARKKMYRVWITNSWYVDVTEDHSLIGYLNTRAKKNVRKIGDRFIEIKPPEIGEVAKSLITMNGALIDDNFVPDVGVKFWELIGLLIGDGSWGGDTYSAKYYLHLSAGLDRDEIVMKVLDPLKRAGVITNYYFEKHRKGDIKILSKNLVKFMRLFKDESGGKRIPEFLYRLPRRCIEAFLRGLFSADGTVIIKRGNPEVRLTSINEGLLKSIRKLLWLVGISNSLFKENNSNKYFGKDIGTYSKHIFIKNKWLFAERVGFLVERKQQKLIEHLKTNSRYKSTFFGLDFDLVGVKKVEEIEYKDYVYDIEVEDTHRFFANGILVHNTDGFYATIPGEKPEAIKQKAKEFLKHINSKLPGMLELEFEGFYTRGFFVTKKRYAVIDEEGRITTRGLEVVRRDWSAIAKETQAKVLEAILKDGSVEKAVKIVKQVVEDLANYRVPVEKLVIYEQITRELSAYKATGPHIAIAKRLKAKGVKVKPGMIINYVVLRGDKKISDRAILLDEYDPKKHKYDPDYYIHNQVLPAVLRILEAFGYKEKDLEYQKTKQMGLDAWFKSKR